MLLFRRGFSTIRPRRSVLYLPGSNARALGKARTLGADCLILDCEDAVSPGSKEVARQQVVGALRSGGYGNTELVARVNGLDTQWGEADVAALAPASAHAILLPKVESVESVERLSALVEAACSAAAVPPPDLWCLIETPLGVLRAAEIAAHPRVACLVMGTADLSAELRVGDEPGRAPLLTSLSCVVLAARAYGTAAIDGVCMRYKDVVACERHYAQGRSLGFDGATLIHPMNIAAANAAFGPAPADVDHARRVIEAYTAAAAEGSALAVLDDTLIEELHVRAARRVLKLANAVEERG